MLMAASRATGAAVPVIATPAGWTEAIQAGATSNQKGPRVAIFYKLNAASESSPVAVSLVTDTNSDMFAVLAEYSGVATSSALDVTASASSDTATTTGDTGTTSGTAVAEELVLVLIANAQDNTQATPANGGTATYGTALAERAEATSGAALAVNKVNGCYIDGITSVAGTVRVTDTISASGRPFGGVAATFKVAGGGTTYTKAGTAVAAVVTSGPDVFEAVKAGMAVCD